MLIQFLFFRSPVPPAELLRSVCPTLLANLHAKPWELELVRAAHEIDQERVESGLDAGYFGACKGPFGNLYLYENVAELSWYMCRWYAFLREPQFRNPLFEATRLVSKVLNAGVASTALFVPDSACDESLALDELHRTMAEVLAWMKERCGPPAESLESIVHEGADSSYSFKGYYVAQWPAGGVGI
jgi:hypothetical protein